ncbi:MAG: oligoendopeptidase F [Firmicutes bacterium]|nr:oligoendopeptidase F [Bacillota bacterium]
MIERKMQRVGDTWDLSTVYQNKNDYLDEYKKVKERIEKIDIYRGQLLKDSKNLLAFLKESEEIERILEKMATYTYRKYDEDLTNVEYQSLKGEFTNLYFLYEEKSSYFVPEIMKEEYDRVHNMILKNDELRPYELLLKRLFDQKKYILSEKEEKLLSVLSPALNESEMISDIVRDAEIQFSKIEDENGNLVEINNENFSVYLKSKDRHVRKDAFHSIYQSYKSYRQTLSETLQGNVMSISFVNKLRGYPSSKDASLIKNRVNPKVYDNLISAVHDKMDVIYDYFKLKKEVLNISDFSLYDTYLNLSDKKEHSYSYEEAKNIVLDVVKVFGDDYTKTVKKAFSERWIDVYPNKGKRGGAYSSGSYDTNPFILLNFQGEYHDLETLIHELGHSMHSYYSNKNNLYTYSSYKIFVAEVASTVNELLLNYYLLENTQDKEEKKYILSEMMELFKSTIYRQTMFSEFEEFVYRSYEKENKVLTYDFLCDKYLELNKEYFGDEVVILDDIKYEWLRVPHFYYNFYVYQYATGLAAACYIVRRIQRKEKNAVEDYLAFLKTGNSMDPLECLKVAGVDMLDSDVIYQALDMFQELIQEFRTLM